jgi:FixJ family two-component response regulator
LGNSYSHRRQDSRVVAKQDVEVGARERLSSGESNACVQLSMSPTNMQSGVPMKPTVFLLDDDPAWLATIMEGLTLLDIPSEAFYKGEDLIERFATANREELRGCVLLDMMMPDMNGEDVFRRLIGLGVRLPIAFLSSHVDTKKASKLAVEGAATYITKTDGQLFEEIQAMLARHADFLGRWAPFGDILSRVASLTPEEHQVFELSVINEKAEWIAGEMNCSVRTAFRTLAEVKEKLNVRTAAELVKANRDWKTASKMRP